MAKGKKPERTVNRRSKSLMDKVRDRINVQSTTMPGDSEKMAEAKRRMISSGELLKPAGHLEHVGYAVVHYYRHPLNENEFYVVTNCPFLKDMNEVQAKLGFDQLESKIMAHFGHNVSQRKTGGLQ